jgi:hypothetical protein
MRYAAKRDTSEDAITEALTDAGYWVAQVSSPGLPDLIVGRKGRKPIVLMECKTGDGKLTSAQLKFWTESAGALRFIVRTPDEALQVAETWIDLERSES